MNQDKRQGTSRHSDDSDVFKKFIFLFFVFCFFRSVKILLEVLICKIFKFFCCAFIKRKMKK